MELGVWLEVRGREYKKRCMEAWGMEKKRKKVTHEWVRAESVQTLGQLGQVLQVCQRMGTVLLGCFVEEYSPNGQTRVGRYGRPRRVGFDILAH